ncbi:hypothetical protein DAI22_07g074300 [Oryza sativa Japonica Group]|jgi:hypothetical protein|nr:hypothetical protein DAI22_07g074300 [Oryza sativa Japonica Group]
MHSGTKTYDSLPCLPGKPENLSLQSQKAMDHGMVLGIAEHINHVYVGQGAAVHVQF